MGEFETADLYLEKAEYLKSKTNLYLKNLSKSCMNHEKCSDIKKSLTMLSINKDNERTKEELKRIEKLGY